MFLGLAHGAAAQIDYRDAVNEIADAGVSRSAGYNLTKTFCEVDKVFDDKFEQRSPSDQNAVDIFRDCWAGMIEHVRPGLTSGQMPLFGPQDNRPTLAAQHLGLTPGSLKGMNVLELGPLEGAHSYQMSMLEADSILAIEANKEAFLKCLIVKEILQTPRCKFILGDCLKFLQERHGPFDLIFCSGILYHMENPVELIKGISLNTDRVFLYTHYYNIDDPNVVKRAARSVFCEGINVTFYEQIYDDPRAGMFSGGLKSTASWLTKADIQRCFSHFGYELTIHEENSHFAWIRATAIRNR